MALGVANRSAMIVSMRVIGFASLFKQTIEYAVFHAISGCYASLKNQVFITIAV